MVVAATAAVADTPEAARRLLMPEAWAMAYSHGTEEQLTEQLEALFKECGGHPRTGGTPLVPPTRPPPVPGALRPDRAGGSVHGLPSP
ncbi:hypothetical protein STSP_17800 [Streptomyces jeddahensis]|uniref:Uncharacterized protein n=1 Tax=Streptomyces jeddahensis TaxID=1716141 RepID=A0A177HXL1_9ACTN|nr:hypothetical protein STSP_17800 [Streptomyces jeddahensis]